MSRDAARRRFAELHARSGVWALPNAWDAGSALLLRSAGFEAVASTSSGLAWSLGTEDQRLTREQLLAHVRSVTAVLDLPFSVDAEDGYAPDPAGVADTVSALAEAGAAGVSIEDYDATTGTVRDLDVATERLAAAIEAAHAVPGAPLVVTARCENPLYGIADLDDTIVRLRAYAAAGADCVYAPGLRSLTEVQTVVSAVSVPVNVLAWPDGPTVAELGAVGVRRVSVGGALASTAYGALLRAATELHDRGTTTFRAGGLTELDRAAFDR
ncbi:isocitrate lyase/PEP mutase family protein [Cellulomonas taurus]|uniref:isocitrate lyase/PEP mutase family protein n=1 Tax=Cellulomonas taurus TaxID=2729175 RepID=UPI00145C8D6B|nr:isocitrate lyase/phosphoenolpyruvate mutase family protein [Cellulomonas taurus]